MAQLATDTTKGQGLNVSFLNEFIVIDKNENVEGYYTEVDKSEKELEMDEKIEYVEDVDDKIGATNLVLEHRTIFKQRKTVS